jgi:3-dehydroquinate synthase
VTLSGVHTGITYTKSPLARVREIAAEASPFFVFDTNTRPLLPAADEESFTVPAGEKFKNWDTAAEIARELLERGTARDGLIVAAGGGVVCDLAAFLASIYMRGMRLVLVPTSLLAMVDASIGGKTGIDFGGYKNILGSFYPAEEVVVSSGFLETLPEREYLNGMAEVIKHALLADGELYRLLREERQRVLDRDTAVLDEILHRSLEVKARYVEEDPKERGIRGHLNLGHTFGHALESVSGLSGRSHGEAVAWGIAKAMAAGAEMGITDPDYAREVTELLDDYGYQISGTGVDPDEIIAATAYDKKKQCGTVRFILQEGRERTLFSPVPREVLKKVLRDG